MIDKDNKPVAYATVIIEKDSTIITAAITDSTGNFTIDKNSKPPLRLQIKMIGYQSIDTVLTSISNNLLFVLRKEDRQLQEVSVTAQKSLIERKVDRLVFNVENSVAASGGTAFRCFGKNAANSRNGR